jgi:hypothetical protein
VHIDGFKPGFLIDEGMRAASLQQEGGKQFSGFFLKKKATATKLIRTYLLENRSNIPPLRQKQKRRKDMALNRLLRRNGLIHTAWLPDYGGLYKRCEEGARESVLCVSPLRMPLDTEDEVLAGIKFDGFDNAIVGREGGHLQAVAGCLDRLMVAGVDLRIREITARNQSGEAGARDNPHGMGIDHIGTRAMINGGGEVLRQRTVAPYIQALNTVADRQDRLVEVEGVLQEQLVDGSAG